MNFLLAFMPASFGTQYYAATAFIGILLFIVSTYYFAYQLLIKVLKTDGAKYLIVTTLFLILSIQFLPSPVQGFYWYASMVTYTAAYSIMLFFFGAVISYLKREKEKGAKEQLAVLIVLALLVSGCNYMVLIFSLLSVMLLILYLVKRKDNKYISFAAVLAVMLAGFVVSMLAPGNMIRGAEFESMSAVLAVLISFPAAMRSVLEIFSNLPVLAGLIVAVLLVSRSVRIANSEFRFQKPWLVFLISWVIYSATFTPTYYAMQGAGMGRVENIRMFLLLWLVLVNFYYIIGYFQRSFEQNIAKNEINGTTLKTMLAQYIGKHRVVFLTFIAVFLVGSFYCTDINKATSLSAAASLLNGEAQQYKAEQMAREALYLSDEKDITVERLTAKPYVLYFWDIEENENGRYEPMEKYYSKDIIIIK